VIRSVLAILITTILLVVSGRLPAEERAIPGNGSDRNDQARQEINKLEKELSQAFVANDADALGRHLSDDWTIITPQGNVLGRSAFLRLIKSGDLTHESMDFAETKVRVFLPTAIVTFRATSAGRFKGQPFTESERTTDIFVKQGPDWKCVQTQLTAITKK
jgi:ketosteroid isomerase-like protein